MDFSTVVEVAIGLIVIYLVLSLLVSEIQELLATVFEGYVRSLKVAIVNLLTGNPASEKGFILVNSLYKNPLIQSLNQQAFWRAKIRRSEEPSYLPSDAFTISLLFVLSQPDSLQLNLEEDLEQVLVKLEQAKSEQRLPEKLIENLETSTRNNFTFFSLGKAFILIILPCSSSL